VKASSNGSVHQEAAAAGLWPRNTHRRRCIIIGSLQYLDGETKTPASVIRWAPPNTSMELASLVALMKKEGEKKRIASCTASEDEGGFYSATHETAAFSFSGGECVIVAWVPHACSHGVPECHVCMFMGKIFFAKE
jgi:hypothetical protein